jgi:acyl-CoA synthetase (AMP-forming)/AMP-acid ligase II
VDVSSTAREIARNPVGAASDVAFDVKTLYDVGLLRPVSPMKLARLTKVLARWGASPAAAPALAAITDPDFVCVRDELGDLDYEEVHKRSNALAHSLAELGVESGDGVGIMCRNHRGFVDASGAAAKLGASILYLNTAFAGRQLIEVMEREGPEVLIYDQEFEDLLEGLPEGITRVVAWHEDDEAEGHRLKELIDDGDRSDVSKPDEDARFVILTSGTTGTPKGAQRSSSNGLGAMVALFDRIPYRRNETIMAAAPMFHSWGFMHFLVGVATGSTLVLQRRFDPEETLKAVADNRANVLAMVPVMMQRILELPEETLRAYDLSSLRITALSGSALPGEMALRWMDLFGDNLYNLYGSTEVAYAAIAGPEDLRAAPGTAGRPPRNTIVKIFDENGQELPQGETGRIFVGSDTAFEGYTGGGGKESIDGLLSSGDVGYFDEDGHLFVAGRDDEMIVSGGENVFPREVEDLLAEHEGVAETAVIGVDDEKFGQRLKAFVVLKDGGQDPSEDELKDYVKKNLARYKVPREVEFMDELPRNATGKVLKRKLREAEEEEGEEEEGEGEETASGQAEEQETEQAG